MKKINFSIVLIILLLFTIGITAFAETKWNVMVDFDENNDLLTVSGNVDHAKSGIPMTLRILDSTNNFIGGFQTTAKVNDENKITFSFESFSLPLTVPSGTYKLQVSGYGVGMAEPYYYKYVGPDLMFGVLTKINKAIIEGTSITDVILDSLSEFYMNIDLDINILKSFNVDAKKVFQAIMARNVYTLPSDVLTAKNKQLVNVKTLEFKTNYQDAIKIASFSNIDTHTDVENWFDTYTDSYNLKADEKLYSYVRRILGKDTKNKTDVYANRLSKRNNLLEEIYIKKAIYEEALLGLIETGYYSELASMVSDVPSLFPVELSFLDLSEKQKNDIYSQIVGNSYADFEEVVAAINSLISGTGDKPNDRGIPSTGSRSNWGTSSGNTISLPSKTIIDNEVPDGQKSTVVEFTDLTDVLWAKDAINYLSERQIVVGRAGGKFAPNDLVSRAEFIKMIVIATNVDMNGGISSFVDVKPSEWFAPYIVAAEKSGLILGNEKNQFNPNQNITRQDMAVILYRAYDINQPLGLSINFDDKDEISDYALEQVAYFAERGIMKGIGNNCFAPMENATRAQATQMIYNILTVRD